MKRILTSVVLLVLLFPSFALGQTVKWKDLVETNGLYYKKFTEVPFTGRVTGRQDGIYQNSSFKDGWKDGTSIRYWGNGRVSIKEIYKDGVLNGPWVQYHATGQLWYKGTYRNGKQVGPWITLNMYGELVSEETYVDGVKIK